MSFAAAGARRDGVVPFVVRIPRPFCSGGFCWKGILHGRPIVGWLITHDTHVCQDYGNTCVKLSGCTENPGVNGCRMSVARHHSILWQSFRLSTRPP